MRDAVRVRLLLASIPVAMTFASAAHAALAPCPGQRGVKCGTVTVPLDRSGAVPGTIDLFVERFPAASGRSRGTLVTLAGGPGESATHFATQFRRDLRPALRDHDLVVFDQRGTGRSAALDCAGLERGDDPSTAVPACAQQLGAASALYTSLDSAEDIDAVRAALGLEKIDLYGVSYGTYVANLYAHLHPDRVDRLVLDSVVSQGAIDDPFRLSLFRALPGVMRSLCRFGRCRGIARDPYADLATLAHRLDRSPLKGKVVDVRGRRRSVQLITAAAALVIVGADVNPWLREQLPAAQREALRGRPGLLLRLADAATLRPVSDVRSFSQGVNIATQCEENTMPWDRSTPPGPDRFTQAQQRIDQIPESAFAPVNRTLDLLAGLIPQCEWWPAGPARTPPTGSVDVSALLLEGSADLRTPLGDARDAAAGFSRAQVFQVPGAGHDTLNSAASSCARRAIPQFLAGRRPTACTRREDLFHPVAAPPRSLASTPAVRGLPARVGRALTAALLTADDALRQTRLREIVLRFATGPVAAGGLLGGTLRGDTDRATLRRAVLIPGVAVSGTVTSRAARLRVAGRGTVRVARGRASGRLGGVRFAVPFARAFGK